jgi:tetratricopeptide (TPR) repeat protein
MTPRSARICAGVGIGLGGVALGIAIGFGLASLQIHPDTRARARAAGEQALAFALVQPTAPATSAAAAAVRDALRLALRHAAEYLPDAANLRSVQLALAELLVESGDPAPARAAFASVIDSARRDHATADLAEAESFAGCLDFQAGNSASAAALEADALALVRSREVAARVRVLTEVNFASDQENRGFRSDRDLDMLRSAIKEAKQQHLTPETATAIAALAKIYYLRGYTRDAQSSFAELLPIYAQRPLELCKLAETYGWLAWISNATDDIPASLPLFRQAYDDYSRCAGPGSRLALDQLPYWADGLIRSGRAAEAVQLLEAALPAWRALDSEPPDPATLLDFLAQAYLSIGRYADADSIAGEYLQRVAGQPTPSRHLLGLAHLVQGRALSAQHRYREALPHAEIAVDLLAKNPVSSYAQTLGRQATDLAGQVTAALKPGS